MCAASASLEEYLPPDHLARFVWRVVEKLDLRDILATYCRDLGGRPALDPEGLLTVMLYSQAVGWSRPAGRRSPSPTSAADNSTFSRFRGRYTDHVAGLLRHPLGSTSSPRLVVTSH